jgi:hypothetical protein
MKALVLHLALLSIGCGARSDLGETDALGEFDLCVTYCTLNRSGSERTACYQPVEACPEDCQNVTFYCGRELNLLVECQLKAGAGLVCSAGNPWVEYLDGVCLEELALRDACMCKALNLALDPCWR